MYIERCSGRFTVCITELNQLLAYYDKNGLNWHVMCLHTCTRLSPVHNLNLPSIKKKPSWLDDGKNIYNAGRPKNVYSHIVYSCWVEFYGRRQKFLVRGRGVMMLNVRHETVVIFNSYTRRRRETILRDPSLYDSSQNVSPAPKSVGRNRSCNNDNCNGNNDGNNT